MKEALHVRNYTYRYLNTIALPMETVRLISRINEYKGKQDLYKQQAPQVLDTLRDVAVIQSTKASNAIEGIVVTESRLHTIMSKSADPADRSEAEIAGYRDVLNLIHASARDIPINANVLLQLHKELYKFVPVEGGRWKNVDNEISESFPDGTRRTRFVPVPAFETPASVQALCDSLRERRQQEDVDPLILTSLFVLDFLSIHPFNDGNGRMSRLLTLLLLYQEGFEVGRYISLEKIVESRKEDYYESLRLSSIHWHQNQQDPFPWVNYLLSTILAAYKELEDRVGLITTGNQNKAGRIRQFVESRITPFTKADVRNACPDVSEATINRLLRELRDEGLIKPSGRGRGAKWIKR
ncbi:Fic family protein [Exiguobacterium sp. PvP048]|uniref:Filamentation induced by cAMP protein Fic n=1 Tax=Exiguobacterium sibiricum (strain DSM 17290 / CCUG 55495 / CIP 109462 / JCM 13490 / 255-15) TaxID=262543 RepID=B1YFV0_EXIS2|nr:filamentation induced by cAMP protein Fic [Exiguobacterium sibiricum 255-15]